MGPPTQNDEGMRRTISSHDRTFVWLGLVTAIAIAISVIAYSSTDAESDRLTADTARLQQLWINAAQVTTAISDQIVAVEAYLLKGSTVDVARYRTAITTEATYSSIMLSQAADAAATDVALGTLAQATSAWRTGYAEPAIRAVQAGGGALLLPFTTESDARREAVDRALVGVRTQLAVAGTALHDHAARLSASRKLGTALMLALSVVATGVGLWVVRRYSRALRLDSERADVLNRFTEYTSFADDDTLIASSNLQALSMLVHPDAGVVHLLNRSRDRAVPEATLGDAPAEILPLNGLSHCPGVVRGSTYVTPDASVPLSVRCPVYPVESGTLACVPLNSGEPVGTVHLYWADPDALPLGLLANVARVAQHAALSIGSRRLLAALHGQASTDARTGLANSRAFDQALEDQLLELAGNGTVGVLMLDLDHFKDFNDRHGHPAGDEALRSFANGLKASLREGDLAARYGGEEFTVLLPGIDAPGALAIAERIRARTDSTLIALGPGITDRITVSIGIAMAPDQGNQGVPLLRLADEALYLAKRAGRNRVAWLGKVVPEPVAPHPLKDTATLLAS